MDIKSVTRKFVRAGLCLSVCAGGLFAGMPAEDGVLLDGVAAYVNRRVVTVGDVMEAMGPLAEQLPRHYRGAELTERMAEAYRATLRNLVDREMVLDDYERAATPIPERRLQARIREINYEHFGGDREEFWRRLAEEGLTLEEWERQIRDGIILSAMREREVDGRLVVSPGEVRSFYLADAARFTTPGGVHLMAIVLHDGAAHPDKAAGLTARLRAGEDFGLLAGEFSGGRRAREGGDWGWIDPAELRAELAGALETIPVGAISDPITVGNDVYILRVAGRRHARVKPIEEVHAEIEREIRRQEARRLYERWIARLEADAYVRKLEMAF